MIQQSATGDTNHYSSQCSVLATHLVQKFCFGIAYLTPYSYSFTDYSYDYIGNINIFTLSLSTTSWH